MFASAFPYFEADAELWVILLMTNILLIFQYFSNILLTIIFLFIIEFWAARDSTILLGAKLRIRYSVRSSLDTRTSHCDSKNMTPRKKYGSHHDLHLKQCQCYILCDTRAPIHDENITSRACFISKSDTEEEKKEK